MVENGSPNRAEIVGKEDLNISKQAACHECRRSKVKCVREPDATACRKCTNAGIDCIVPKYHVGRYKGVKNKRSGLDKAIHQVEEAVKKARTKGTTIQDGHARILRQLLSETQNDDEDLIRRPRMGLGEDDCATTTASSSTRYTSTTQQDVSSIQLDEPEPAVQIVSENGEAMFNNANNPLQLLAIASSIPEPAFNSSPSITLNTTQSNITTDNTDEYETHDFFSPMVSKLDVKNDLDPLSLGLVSQGEVEMLFNYFNDHLAHTRWGIDPLVHTPHFVRSRSAYLFTSILSCAALFLPEMTALSVRLNNHCKLLGRQTPQNGYRSLEIVLAYMINVPWAQPQKNWAADDETCYFISTAMTIAIDLSLNKIVTPSSTVRPQHTMDRIPQADYIDARRALDMDCHSDVEPSSIFGRRLLRARERTWLALFNLDRGGCLARGRPWTVPGGPLVETCDAWHVSDIADVWDGSLVASAVLRRDFAALVSNVRATCDAHQYNIDGCANVVKMMREKVEGFFTQWYQTWTYQIKQSDGTLPPYVEILVSHGRLSAYCNVINHPTASTEVKQFFRAAALTAALNVVNIAVQNEVKLHSIPNNSVIMVSFAACFILGLSTTKRRGHIFIAEHVRASIHDVASALERIGSSPAHRKGASTLFGRHIKHIMRQCTTTVDEPAPLSGQRVSEMDGATVSSTSNFGLAPFTLHSLSDNTRSSFPGFDSMTDEQLLKAIQQSKDDIDTFNAEMQNDDSLFTDWLDWPTLT